MVHKRYRILTSLNTLMQISEVSLMITLVVMFQEDLDLHVNGDNFDADEAGNLGYGDNPPAVGVDFFEGPYLDADRIEITQDHIMMRHLIQRSYPSVNDAFNGNGIVYSGIGVGYGDGIIDNERFGMRRFTYYTSTSAFPYNDPGNAAEYYNFMSGSWANGSATVYGGLGYVGSTGATSHSY